MRGMISTLTMSGNVWKIRSIRVDDIGFWFNYRLTPMLLTFCALIVASKQFFDEPISCQPGDGDVDFHEPAVNLFCYIHYTYSCFDDASFGYSNVELYPGVKPCLTGGVGQDIEQQVVVTHSYYPWVSLFLLTQATCFYVPHVLWKKIENNKVRQLLQDLGSPVLEEEEKSSQLNLLLYYILSHLNMHGSYGHGYLFCQGICLINCFFQIYITHWFLGGPIGRGFIEYVPNWILHERNMNMHTPSEILFPLMGICNFKKVGPSGSTQSFNYLCTLPLNFMHDKVYFVLWVWFWVVLFMTVHSFLRNFAHLVIPMSRSLPGITNKITSFLSYGDWFLMSKLQQNMDKVHFLELIYRLDGELKAYA